MGPVIPILFPEGCFMSEGAMLVEVDGIEVVMLVGVDEAMLSWLIIL